MLIQVYIMYEVFYGYFMQVPICYKQFLYAFWSEKQTEMTGYTFLIFILKFTISIQCCIGLLSAKFTHLF